MMNLTAQTKIGSILKLHPEALDAIVSISPRFEKLRNPLLRKLIAGRTTLAEAARIGGCDLKTFYAKLRPLGFTVEASSEETASLSPSAEWKNAVLPEKIVELDVRPTLAAGTDPLQIILAKVKSLKNDEALKIINTFEPTPLMHLLEKKGMQSHTDKINEELYHTFFYRTTAELKPEAKPSENSTAEKSGDWNSLLEKFEAKKETLDVRHLEMPQPMLAILEKLDSLPADYALYVYHKRIPVYLLQELADRGFEYRIQEVADGDVRLLIFKNE